MNQTFAAEHQFSSAIIVGTIESVSKKTEFDLLRIMNCFAAVLPTTALIINSNPSNRDSEKILLDLDPRVKYVSVDHETHLGITNNSQSRALRNMYVKGIRENLAYANCELVVVVDLDGRNTEITESVVRIALDSAFQWDALAANQEGKYRDIESLRHEFWSPNNNIDEFRWFRFFVSEKQAWKNAVGRRIIRISKRNPPILVDSAFGGLCIYKRWIFEKFDYSADGKLAESENPHVTINRKSRAGGAQIFIHPALINSNGRSLYFFRERIIRWLKRIAHSFPFAFFFPYLRERRATCQKR